jgi:hypothetical protein
MVQSLNEVLVSLHAVGMSTNNVHGIVLSVLPRIRHQLGRECSHKAFWKAQATN